MDGVTLEQVGWLLRGDATTSLVTGALAAAGVPALLVKGSSTERWLYRTDEGRRSVDVDVLVAPSALGAAEDVLDRLGFVSRFDGHAPSWTDQHAHAWVSEGEHLPVDLHRELFGCSTDPEAVFTRLWADRERMVVGRVEVSVPSRAARAMMLAIHRFQHGEQGPQAAEDLRRCLEREPSATWSQAAALAREFGGLVGFVQGLACDDQGHGVLAELQLDPAANPGAPPIAEVASLLPAEEGWLRIRRASGASETLAVAWHELFPSPRFMRVRSAQAELAQRGRLGLGAAYVRRLAVTLRAALSSSRVRASSSVRSSGPLRRD